MDVWRFPEHLTLLWEAPEKVEVNNFVFLSRSEQCEINKTWSHWSNEGPKPAWGVDVQRAGINALPDIPALDCLTLLLVAHHILGLFHNAEQNVEQKSLGTG